MDSIRGFLRGQPFWIDALVFLLVGMHYVATWRDWIPNIWAALSEPSNQAASQGIYLGMLGPAAIVAGFAGVVIVFGITASSERFRRFRAEAGKSLRRTWVSSSLSGFEAVGFAIAASLLNVSGLTLLAAFAFEISLLLLTHGALRLIWILAQMIGIVRADDVVATDDARKFKLTRLPDKSKAG